jgi:hypothetical protein
MLVEGFAPYDLLLTPGESDLLVFGRADALFTGDGRSMFSFDTTMLTQQAGITFPVLNNLGFQYPPPFINYFAGTTHVRSSADGDTMLIFADNGDIHRFDPASKTVIESVTTGFLAPTGVFSTESSHAGSLLDESFVLASFHEFNDGLARLTLTSTVCSNVCGDLDGDEDVDAGDFDIFVMAFGLAMDDPGYDRCADYDDDVAITLVDYQNWLLCYQDFTGDPGAPAPALPNMGDFDRDNDVDLVDFADFQSCVAGGASPLLCGAQFDFNDDGDVTEADMSGFSLLLAGPAAP